MPPTFPPAQTRAKKWKRPLLVLSIVPIVLLGALVYHALTFHIVRTDPSLSRVGNYSPYLRVYFNKPLDSSKVKIGDTQNIVSDTSIEGKTITFNFKSGALTIGQHYTFVLDRVVSTSGDVIDHKTFSFDAKDIPINSLSAEQQRTIVGSQDHFPYSVHSITFSNFDDLTNNGLTADQEQVVRQAIFDYSQKINTKFSTVKLDATTITPGPFDPNSENVSRSLTFSVTADGTPYDLLVTYDDLSTATVVIHDQSGTVVFNSSQ